MLALPFIPADQTATVFQELTSQVNTPELLQLNAYISSTWIDSDLWPPTSWSCYKRSIRTNNDVEAWHARLSRRTGVGNLGVYQLAERWADESKLVALTMTCMTEKAVVRYQKASTARINAAVGKYNTEYDAGRRSAMKLLSGCARVYAHSLRQ